MNSNHPVHGYPLQLTSSENHLTNFSASYQQWASTGGLFYTQPQPNFPAPSFPIRSAATTLGTTTVTTRNRWECRICAESFPRRQERDRHELKHVPYFIHCPLSHCAWRGNRINLFKKHWQQEGHRRYHEYYGRTPERSQFETFDPRLILNQIISGAISLREGEDQAIFLVQAKAFELQKMSMVMDPWGRKKSFIEQARARW